MEADAHLGLANRLAAPFAQRVFLSFPIDGRGAAEILRHRSADPDARKRALPGGGAAALQASCNGPVLFVFGGSWARTV